MNEIETPIQGAAEDRAAPAHAKRPHFVDSAPYDPSEDLGGGARPDLDAPAWRLILRRLMRHRLAAVSGVFLLALYLLLPVMGFLAPYGSNAIDENHLYAPPQQVRFFHDGDFIGPFVYRLQEKPDLAMFSWRYVEDRSAPQPIRFFCHGESYRLAGLIETDAHLICPAVDGTLFLLGADRLGRDIFSRILYGAQLSLTIGLIGIMVSFAIGVTLGGMAGYFGGTLDWVLMRLIEVLRSLPELPLWLALSAAVPSNWSPVAVFFMISIILGMLDWPGLARAVRSKFLSLREEDFVRAAELMGAKPGRVIRRHLMPNFMSHLVASATLSIPSMILGETALSYLGLGLRPPAVSWGVMLNDAQSLTSVEIYPWVSTPIVPVILVVLAFNFLGDGLRDALDPYHAGR